MRMALIVLEPEADATKCTGDETVAPEAGEETVTPAKAVTLNNVIVQLAKINAFSSLANIKKSELQTICARDGQRLRGQLLWL